MPDGLRLQDVTVTYGDAIALLNVSMRVERGYLVGVVGPNGAGKTTLLNTIGGSLRPRHGVIEWEGHSIGGKPPYTVVRRGVVLVPEGRQLVADLSVIDNLRAGAVAAGIPHSLHLDMVLAAFPLLKSMLDRPAGALSGGEQQMVAIGRGLMAAPRLLMVDELSLGLGPMVAKEILTTLQRLTESNGLSVLVVDQNLKLLSTAVSRFYILTQGRISTPLSVDSLDDLSAIDAYISGAKPAEVLNLEKGRS